MGIRAPNAVLGFCLIGMLVGLLSGCGGGDGEEAGEAAETASVDGIEEETMLYFPWPPPRSSAVARIPAEFFVEGDGVSSLGFAAHRLERALEQAGYRNLQFYAIPGDSLPSGFALVTPLEQINDDASPKPESSRWAPNGVLSRRMPLWEYLKAAIRGNPGHYRAIVFLTTSRALREDSIKVTESVARAWQEGGWNYPPEWLWDLPYTPRHKTTALIYEFSQTSLDSEPEIVASGIRGSTHLYRARIWPALGD